MKKIRSLSLFFACLTGLSLSGLTSCGGVEKIEGSEGLIYELSEDGSSYIMTDASKCTVKDVVVGNWHDDLPVTGIGDMAFKFQEGLNSVTVAEGVTSYGECWLDNGTCTKVTLPNGVESMGIAAFLICFELKELVIGTGLKTIEVDTFEKVNEDFTIYFRGSEEEWNDVEVADRGNDILETCKMVFDYKD